MDLSTSVLFGIVAVLACNQAVMRIEALGRRPVVFWSVCVVDLAAGIALLIFGLPGFEAVPAVSWVVGLLFVFHVAQNLNMRSHWQHTDRQIEIEALRREHALLRAERGEE